MTTPIPQPPTIPFLGNVHLIDNEIPLNTFLLLAKQYGPIYKLNFIGREVIVVANYNLVNKVSDETKVRKPINPVLEEVRNAVGDGLFTAYPEEENWGIARKLADPFLDRFSSHPLPDRILMPAFGPASIRGMWEDGLHGYSRL